MVPLVGNAEARGRTFQVAGTASGRAFRWDQAWCLPGSEGRAVSGGQWEAVGGQRGEQGPDHVCLWALGRTLRIVYKGQEW